MQERPSLETIEVETAPSPQAAVIWLHGLGADGHDFEPVVPQLVRGRERAWRFVFPHAPVQAVTINGGMRMRAWYDIRGLERTATEDLEGFQRSDASVRALIEREAARGIPSSRVVLAGFSQGGAVALYSGLRYPQRLAGLMALSCYLPLRGALHECTEANAGVRIFMAHGLSDGVLPLALGAASRRALEARGYAVEWHQYPMAHSVCPAELEDIREFLFRVLA
ncbi:MAG TPA: alpha/beta hydrolase-fold protein [Steroidobacteraceae bacterium]|nr:alpha/beta hydrolase-fold protein [Steroidobacteraceae bacterium]